MNLYEPRAGVQAAGKRRGTPRNRTQDMRRGPRNTKKRLPFAYLGFVVIDVSSYAPLGFSALRADLIERLMDSRMYRFPGLLSAAPSGRTTIAQQQLVAGRTAKSDHEPNIRTRALGNDTRAASPQNCFGASLPQQTGSPCLRAAQAAVPAAPQRGAKWLMPRAQRSHPSRGPRSASRARKYCH